MNQELFQVLTHVDEFFQIFFLNPHIAYKKYVIKELEINFMLSQSYSETKPSQPEVQGLFITPSHTPNSLCIIL